MLGLSLKWALDKQAERGLDFTQFAEARDKPKS